MIEFNDAAMAMAHAGTLSNKRSATPDELQKGLQRVLRDNIAQVVVLETVPHPDLDAAQLLDGGEFYEYSERML